ncbi:DAK2 domain-containing protein [Streptomyces sp. NPDC059786]|uniref:DAK2 domain-containing protein n=1 Tax=Streptomyces sp. NPDC059786 TaxID=3346946 RepID=UPI00365E58BC
MTTDQRTVLRTYTDAVHTAHDTLTALDQISGDGDFGDNIAEGLDRTAAALEKSPGEAPFAVAARIFLDEVGGTSGPLMGLLFQEIAAAFAAHDDDRAAWRAGVREGLAAIQRVGEAQPGDRTLVDALVPARDALDAGADVRDVAVAALDGARATADLRARMGRASYVGERALGFPDPGATGVALLFWSLATAEGHSPGDLADQLPSVDTAGTGG